MCIDTVDKKEITEKIKATIPEDGLTVYKVVVERYSKYHPLHRYVTTPFKPDRNEANTEHMITARIRRYISGYHFWLNKKDATKHEKYLKDIHYGNVRLIECVVKKEWITATGTNEIPTSDRKRMFGKTVIAKIAIFPEYKE